MEFPPALPEDGLPAGQRAWAMATIALTISLAVLDAAAVNVALPTIARDLRATPMAAIWVVNAFQLAVMVSLLPLASLGDSLGYARVYRAGLAIFTAGALASFACAFTGSLALLTVARVAQGFGAAGIMSVNTALVRVIHPRDRLGRGLGMNALIVAISSAAGPTVAAGVLAIASWPFLFAIDIPFGIAALVIARRTLPDSAGTGHRFDMPSALLNALAFGLLITAISGFAHGLGARLAGLELLGAAITLALLVERQRAKTAPLFPIDLLRRADFALAVGTSVGAFGAQTLALVSLPFFLQGPLGRNQVETGLLMSAWPASLALVAPISGRLADRYPPGILCGIGLGAMLAGLLALAQLPAQPTGLDIVWRMGICGIGFGLFQSPNNRAMLAAAPAGRSGGASGMLSTARLTGQTVGAALVALVFALGGTDAARVTLLLAASFSATGAVVSSVRLARPGRRAAQQEAD